MKKKAISSWKIIFLLFLVIGSVWTIHHHQAGSIFHKTEGQVFGTTYHITYQSKKELTDSILSELSRVNNSLSPFNKTSIITAINENVPVDTDTLFREVFRLSQYIAQETDGAFDITVAPLVNAWGFGFKHKQTITPERIDSMLETIGYQKVTLENNRIKKQNPNTMIDCSAIAKGYGCDQVARMFMRQGVQNFMIEIGGELVVNGTNPQKKPWKIGINKPVEDSLNTNKNLQAIIELKNIAMATSGNYRNFYYKEGQKYAHTINPHTGYPVEHTLLSATVLAPTCAEADAYATAFMVMGLEQAKKILLKQPHLQAYFIYTDKDGKMCVWNSPQLTDKLVSTSNS